MHIHIMMYFQILKSKWKLIKFILIIKKNKKNNYKLKAIQM